MDTKMQTLTDKSFDVELNALIGRYYNAGVHPTVMTGCLTLAVIDMHRNIERNQAAIRAKAQETVGDAIALFQPPTNGKISDMLAAAKPPAVHPPGDKSEILVRE